MENYDNIQTGGQISETVDVNKNMGEGFSYEGYQVVRGLFFAHLFEPSVKLADEKVSVNSACIRKLPGTEYVQFLVNRVEKKLAVKPCAEDAKDSFCWASRGKDGKVKPKIISCRPFYARVMKLMGWDPDKRYRILGKLVRTKTENIFVFDLNNVEIFTKGERTAGKKKNPPAFPTEWSDSFGVSVQEHDSETLINMFEGDSVFYLEKEDKANKTEVTDNAE